MVANLLCLFASECYHTNVVKRVLVSIIINQGGYKCFQLFRTQWYKVSFNKGILLYILIKITQMRLLPCARFSQKRALLGKNYDDQKIHSWEILTISA